MLFVYVEYVCLDVLYILESMCVDLGQGIIMERQLPRGTALPRLIHSLSMLLVVSAPNNPSRGEVVPTVAEAQLLSSLNSKLSGVSDLAHWAVAL